MPPDTILEARAVSRQYPGTLALDRADFPVYRAKVNVLVGENGAGKSTLMRILAGIEQPTSGELILDGRPIRLTSARDAAARGIAKIHQELNLLPNLSVSDNIFMAREMVRHGVIDRRGQEHRTRDLLARLGQPVEPRALVGDLPLGQQQIVEIAKALAQDISILIMDEPTSALSAAEIAVLFRVIRDLKSHGVSIVYISHHLEELLAIGDHIHVLRDGRAVANAPANSVTVPWIVEQMTGSTGITASSPPSAPSAAPPLLSIRFPGLSLDACGGEIIGLYGLLGAGRTELFEACIGLRPTPGPIVLAGRPIEQLGIPARIRRGLALVPEERQAAGIVPPLSVGENMTLASLKGIYLSPGTERRRAGALATDLHIRTAGLDRPITSLSGGNQQKVVLARYLLTAPKVLLLDEPTRGVDVGARAEIYAIIRRLASEGMAVLFASSELQEVQTLATRIVVMARGRITAEFPAAEATEEALVSASSPAAMPC